MNITISININNNLEGVSNTISRLLDEKIQQIKKDIVNEIADRVTSNLVEFAFLAEDFVEAREAFREYMSKKVSEEVMREENNVVYEDSDEEFIIPDDLDEDSDEEFIIPDDLDEDSDEEFIIPDDLDEDSDEEFIIPDDLDKDSDEEFIIPDDLDEDSDEEFII
ncbi:MAG: hypothetical protein QXW48_01420 [Thermoplasmata archaeon]